VWVPFVICFDQARRMIRWIIYLWPWCVIYI
jgi:hypothetical protein